MGTAGMTCGTCGAEAPDGGTFCPNCGGRLREEVRGPGEVDVSWLRGIAERVGYRAVPDLGDASSVFLAHDQRANLSLRVPAGARVIGISAAFRFQATPVADPVKLYEAINRANQASLTTTWFVGGDRDCVWAYTFERLLGPVSDRQVARILDAFNEEVWAILQGSGLSAF
jgi:hypothetical protein